MFTRLKKVSARVHFLAASLVLLGTVLIPLINTAPVEASGTTPVWPVAGFDGRHTGRSPFAGPTQKHVKWVFDSGGQMNGSPVIGADGTLYFGNGENGSNDPGAFYAMNPNGTVKWQFDDGTAFNASPAIADDGTIYAAARESKIYAFNPDGTVKWTVSTIENGIGGEQNGAVKIAQDGTIYTGSANGILHAINPDGSIKWKYNTGFIYKSEPVIASDGTVYIGNNTGTLFAINPDGTLKWSRSTSSNSATPAISDNGTLYVNGGTGLDAINPDGSLQWHFAHTNGSPQANPQAAVGNDGTIYVGTHEQLGKLYAINPDGTVKWSYMTGAIAFGSPIIDTVGNVYTGSVSSNENQPVNATYAFDANGTLLWTHEGDGVVSTPAMGTDGTLYTTSSSGRLTAFSVNAVPDTQPPQIVINAPTDTVTTTASINVTITDISDYTVTYKIDGTTLSSAQNGDELDLTYLTAGQHTFSVTAVDTAGNSATVSSQFTYQPTAQTISETMAQMYADGAITQLGSSLNTKLAQAQAYIDSGSIDQATRTLDSLYNQVQAQIDIHITASAGTILLNQIRYLQNSLTT